MFSKGPTYSRRALAAPRIQTESEELADAFFGSVKSVLPPPVPKPSAAPPPTHTQSSESSSPETVRKPSRKPTRKKTKISHRKWPSPQHDPEEFSVGTLREAGRDTFLSSEQFRNTSALFKEADKAVSQKKPGKKKSPKKAPSVGDVSVRKGTNSRLQPESRLQMDPADQDPEYLRFMAQMDDLKNHTLHIQDETDYWREVRANADEEMGRLVSGRQEGHAPGFSLTRHEAKVLAERKEKEKKMAKSALVSIVETRESDFEDETTPLQSTPVVTKRKRPRHFPEVSRIAEMSPIGPPTSFVRPNNFSKRKTKRRVSEAPVVSTPLDSGRARPLRLDVSAVQETSPLAQNLSRDFQEVDTERVNTISTEAGELLALREGQARPTVPGAGAATTTSYRMSTRQMRDLKKGAFSGSSRPVNEDSMAVEGLHGNVSIDATATRSRRNLQTAAPVAPSTSSSPLQSARKRPLPTPVQRHRRESLPIFSPAITASQEDKRILSQSQATRSTRKSVVLHADRKSPLELLLEIARPPRIVHTDKILGQDYTDLRKIGEGSYADVYSAYWNGQEVVMKIVPVNGLYCNKERQTSYGDILSESLISMEITTVLMDLNSTRFYAPVFARTHFVKIARGPYPDEFSDKHDSFARAYEDEALNQHPVAYSPQQQYVILGLNNGGRALDTFSLANFSQAKSIFQQVALGLAVAEKALEFEHRDAHISNILIRVTSEKEIRFLLDQVEYGVPSHGVHVTIIDWTLSRMRSGAKIVYKDLAEDEKIFAGRGDDQFDVYRDMRKWNGNNWQSFLPKSNVRWLKYLQQKLLKEKAIADDPVKKILRDLNNRGKLMTFQSALDLVRNAQMFKDCLR